MKNFDRGGREGGSRGGFHGGGKFKGGFKGGFNKDRNSGPVTLHAATCASCKKACEIPFRPTGDKPVYCRDCFAGRAAMGGERSHRSDRRDFKPASSYTREERSSTPSFNRAHGSEGNADIKKQLEVITTKLDKLISSVYALSNPQTQAPIKTEPSIEDAPQEEPKKSPKKVSKKK